MYASDAEQIDEIKEGQIGVIAGLKYARTGDTLITYSGASPKTGPPAPLNDLHLRPIDVPPPVFFAAIEPHSLSEEKNVEQILTLLLREDPSLHVSVDEESGQMLLSGMGELHLEIARDRLVNDFKAKATMGNIEIGYRECALSPSTIEHVLVDREIAGKKGMAGCYALVAPFDPLDVDMGDTIERDGNYITVRLDTTNPEDHTQAVVLPETLPLIDLRNGAAAALARGPKRHFPMTGVHAELTFQVARDFHGPATNGAALSTAAHQAVRAALQQLGDNGETGLMEPVMDVTISCDEASLGNIVHDISSARGGHVVSLGEDSSVDTGDAVRRDTAIDISRIYAPRDPFESIVSGGEHRKEPGPGSQRQVRAKVPLKEMIGYLKHLRSITQGRGTFVMAFEKFERVQGQREKAISPY
jgi:elongation factor G